MATTDYLVFANNTNNITPQQNYLTQSPAGNVFESVAISSLHNKALRQATDVANAFTQVIADYTQTNITDTTLSGGNSAFIQSLFKQAVASSAWTNPEAFQVGDEFIGYCNASILSGSTFTTNNSASAPINYTSSKFPFATTASWGRGMAQLGNVFVVSTGGNIAQYITTTDSTLNPCPNMSAGQTIELMNADSQYIVGLDPNTASRLAYSTAPDQAWTFKTISGTTGVPVRIKKGNNQWVVLTSISAFYFSDPVSVVSYSPIPSQPGGAGLYTSYEFAFGRHWFGGTNQGNTQVAITNIVNTTGNTYTITLSQPITVYQNQYITISSVLPNAFNNVNTNIQLRIGQTYINQTQIQISYASSPGTYISGGLLTLCPKLVSYADPLSPTSVGQYEFTTNLINQPQTVNSLTFDGSSNLAFVGDRSSNISFYNGTTWNSTTYDANAGTTYDSLDSRVTTQLIGTPSVRYWFITAQSQLAGPKLYISAANTLGSFAPAVLPATTIGDLNRTGNFNNVLYIGQTGGLLTCLYTNNIYSFPQLALAPSGSYKSKGKTSSAENFYNFVRVS